MPALPHEVLQGGDSSVAAQTYLVIRSGSLQLKNCIICSLLVEGRVQLAILREPIQNILFVHIRFWQILDFLASCTVSDLDRQVVV